MKIKMDEKVMEIAKALLTKYGNSQEVERAILKMDSPKSDNRKNPESWIADKVMGRFWKAQNIERKDCGICLVGSDLTKHRFFGSRNGGIHYHRIPQDENWDSEISYREFLEIWQVPTFVSIISVTAIQEIEYMETKVIQKGETTKGRKGKTLAEKESQLKKGILEMLKDGIIELSEEERQKLGTEVSS